MCIRDSANGAAATCGDSGESIPSYLLPLSVGKQEGLYFWLNEYQALDRLWINSGELEMPTYKQMAKPNRASALAVENSVLIWKRPQANQLTTT